MKQAVRPLYLDHNATAPISPLAIAAMTEAMRWVGNPSSIHAAGRAARRVVETAREALARALGVASEGVVFTASGSEANALALSGFPNRVSLISAVEHDSVLANAPGALVLPVDGDGVLSLKALSDALDQLQGAPALISVMAANNETGVIQPIAEIATLAHAAGALLHCDAVQAFGRTSFDMAVLGVDLATVSAHKDGGPMGAAALVARPGVDPRPLIRGGGQERNRRAGTENVPALAGWGAIFADDTPRADWAGVAALRDGFEALVQAEGGIVVGSSAPRLPNTSTIVMPGVDAATQVMAFDLAGIAISAGSACSSGKVKSSHVLAAMGVPSDLARAAVRVSLGPTTSADDMARAAAAWITLARRRPRSAA